MSDLISRSALIEYLEKVTVTEGITFDTGFKQILTDIRNAPTAYDLDKVVRELEELKDEYDHSCIADTYQRGASDGAKWFKKKAIEIARRGVSNEID